MVDTTSPKHMWTTSKCHRVLRPLSSKLQSLRSLIGSHPSLVNNGVGNGNNFWSSSAPSLEQGTTWEKIYRTSAHIRKYSVKLTSSRHQASGQEPDKTSHYCADNLLLSLRDKTTPEVYAAYRSIFHAFHHFMLQTYRSPSTLSQKSAIELGKCVVYTLGSVSEDDWYDGMEVLKYYKRSIAIGHGVSLVARDAEICRDLLPALIVDCAEMEAFDMGLLLLRSYLEVTTIDDILANYDMICDLTGLLKSSPYVLLQYIMANLTVEHIIHSNLVEILNRLLANRVYDAYSQDSRLRDMLCHIFATSRREVRHSSHPRFKQIESALLGISRIICRYPDLFDLSFTTRLIDIIGPAKARFTSVWQLLCIHQFYLGYINDEFVQYFYSPSTTPSASFRVRSRLRSALVDIYTDFEGQVKPIITSIMPNLPKFAVALATLFSAKFRDTDVLRWRRDVETSAMQLDRGLRAKKWVHDESLEEWVEVQEEDDGGTFSLVSDGESEDDDFAESVSEPENDELERMVNGQLIPDTYSEDPGPVTISSPVTLARPSGASRILYTLPPPSSVVKLTPRSNRRIRDKYFRLLSTPATGGDAESRSSKLDWFTRSQTSTLVSDDEEFEDDGDELENVSPLQGRKRTSSSDRDDQMKKSKGFMTSHASKDDAFFSSRNASKMVEEVDELSMAVSVDRKRLGDLTNCSRGPVKITTSGIGSNRSHGQQQSRGSSNGRKVYSEQENNAGEEEEDELFAVKGLNCTIDSSSFRL
ncbi:hypothetical protein V1509DRAFT_315175 [Lipomyces kononenkoae]